MLQRNSDAEIFYVGTYHEKDMTHNVRTTYYTFGGARVGMRQGNEVYWLHSDHLGSASLTTSITGAVVSEMRYYPFGETRWVSGTLPADRLFTDAGFSKWLLKYRQMKVVIHPLHLPHRMGYGDKRMTKIIVFLLCSLLIASCNFFEPAAPARNFTTDDLLIDVSSLPDGWIYLHRWKPDYQGTSDRISVIFKFPDADCLLCITSQDVHRYEKIAYAKFAFQRMASGLPAVDSTIWTYKSSHADETAFVCWYHQGDQRPHCRLSARYQEVIIELRATIMSGTMTYADLEGVASAIDARVKSYMER